MIEIYSKILVYTPLRKYEDILEEYYNTYPKKSEDDFINEYNTSEKDYI